MFLFNSNSYRAESEKDHGEKLESDDDEMGEFSVYECPGLAPVSVEYIKNACVNHSV